MREGGLALFYQSNSFAEKWEWVLISWMFHVEQPVIATSVLSNKNYVNLGIGFLGILASFTFTYQSNSRKLGPSKSSFLNCRQIFVHQD